MGFLFSKYPSPLRESLLHSCETTIITRPGDLILVPSSELYITLNDDIWQHVGIVVQYSGTQHVFVDGLFVNFKTFIEKHDSDQGLYLRQLDCVRPSFFNKQLVEWAQELSNLDLEMDARFYEGYAVGFLLAKMKCCLQNEVKRGGLLPYHFSSGTPFKRLQIRNYSDNIHFN
jgi:hypothetical protein